MKRSDNCKNGYHKTLSTVVGGTIRFPGEDPKKCPSIPITDHFSCQDSDFEHPDAATVHTIKREHQSDLLDRKAKGCDVSKARYDFQVNLNGTNKVDYSGEKLASVGMNSNCFEGGNDPNDGTHVAKARCSYVNTDHPLQAFDLDKKKLVPIPPDKKWEASLMTCSLMPKDEPQILEDLQRVIAHNAANHTGDQPRYHLDDPTNTLVCDLMIAPWHV